MTKIYLVSKINLGMFQLKLIYFNSIVKQTIFRYVNHTRIRSSNQVVLCAMRVPFFLLKETSEAYVVRTQDYPIPSQTL